jgi:hypothetical protein
VSPLTCIPVEGSELSPRSREIELVFNYEFLITHEVEVDLLTLNSVEQKDFSPFRGIAIGKFQEFGIIKSFELKFIVFSSLPNFIETRPIPSFIFSCIYTYHVHFLERPERLHVSLDMILNTTRY